MANPLKSCSEAIGSMADTLNTPIVKGAGRLLFWGLLAIALYAGKTYMHEFIASDASIVAIKADTQSAKGAIETHENFIKSQTQLNAKLSDYFKESRDARQDTTNRLSSIATSLVDQEKRLDRIETRLDR